MGLDFEKWMLDMRQECDRIDNTGELSYRLNQTEDCFKQLHDYYYSAKSKGDMTACRALAIDFSKLLSAFTAAMWQIDLERSSIETLMWSSIQFCMSEQDWKSFYFIPQAFLCNDKYRVDFGAFKQGSDEMFLAVECDGFAYHYSSKEQISKDNNRQREIQYSGVEVLRVLGSDIYKNPLAEAEKILIHIRGKYFSESFR